jgi:antitoxin MazE
LSKVFGESCHKIGKFKDPKLDQSLIVRLPDELIESLNLKEGDDVDLQVVQKPVGKLQTDQDRQQAIAQLRALSVLFPPAFKFDREEANARR